MANNKFCTECGFELSRTAKFCEECGEKLPVSVTNKSAIEINEVIEELEEEEVEEIEEKPSEAQKRQEASAYWRQQRIDAETKDRQERLGSYETEKSNKKEIDEEEVEERPSYLKKRQKASTPPIPESKEKSKYWREEVEEEIEEVEERPSYLKKRQKAPPKEPKIRTMHDVAKEISESNLEDIQEVESDEEKIIADELGIDLENTKNIIKESRENNTCPNCFEKLSKDKINELEQSNAEYVYCENCDVIFDKFQKEVRKELRNEGFHETEKSSKKQSPAKKKWYKSGVFIACMIFIFIPIVNEISACGGICPTLGTKGLTTIITFPIVGVLIPVGIFRLIRKLIKSIK